MAISAWTLHRDANDAAELLTAEGIAAAPDNTMLDLVNCEHLKARSFWETSREGALPGLPWRASFGRVNGPSPALGADTDMVLRDVLGITDDEIGRMRAEGVFG